MKRNEQAALDAKLMGEARVQATRVSRDDEMAYVEVRSGHTLTVYGPFHSEKDAARANLFRRSLDEASAASRASEIRSFMRRGVTRHTASEIEYMRDSHEEMGVKRVVFKAPAALHAHPSWAALRTPESWFEDLWK